MPFNNDQRKVFESQIKFARQQLDSFEKGLKAISKQALGFHSRVLHIKAAVATEYAQKLDAQSKAAPIGAIRPLRLDEQKLFDGIIQSLDKPSPALDTLISMLSIDAINARDEKGMTILMHAAAKTNGATIEKIIAKGAPTDLFDLAGHNALYHAAKNPYGSAFRALAEKSDVNHRYIDTGDTATHILVQESNRPGRVLVLESQDDLPATRDLYAGNSTAINIAGQLAIASQQGGVRPDGYSTKQYINLQTLKIPALANSLAMQNFDGYTPLTYAVEEGLRFLSKSLVEFMASRKISLDTQDHHGQTALYKAVASNFGDIVDSLLSSKANTAIPDENGISPLMRAEFAIFVNLLTGNQLRSQGQVAAAAQQDALKMSSLGIMQKLAALGISDATSTNFHSISHNALLFAIGTGVFDLADILIPSVDLASMGAKHQSAFQSAIVATKTNPANAPLATKCLKTMLEKDKANGSVVLKTLDGMGDDYGMTSLAWAAKDQAYALEILKLLMEFGSNPNFVVHTHVDSINVNGKPGINDVQVIDSVFAQTLEGRIAITKSILGCAIEGLMQSYADPAKLEQQHAKIARIFYSSNFTSKDFVDSQGFNIVHWLSADPKAARMIHDLSREFPEFFKATDISGKTALDYAIGYWNQMLGAGNQSVASGFAQVIAELVEHGSPVKPEYNGYMAVANAHAVHESLVHTAEFMGAAAYFADFEA